MNEMELQDRQYELDGASNVYVGPPGADGITPTVIVEDITGGHQVSFYYGAGDSRNKSFTVPNGQNGTDGTDGKDGADGSDGTDGVTPSVIVTDITGGHNVAFSYGAGDPRNTNFDVMNGAQGPAGPGNVFIATITQNGSQLVSDMSVSEIYAEAQAGKVGFAVYGVETYILQYAYSTVCAFMCLTGSANGVMTYRLYMDSTNPNRVYRETAYANAAPTPCIRSQGIELLDNGSGGYDMSVFDAEGAWNVPNMVLIYKTTSEDPLCEGVFDTYREFQLVKRWMTGETDPQTMYNSFTTHYLFQQIYDGKLCQFLVEGGLHSQDFTDWTAVYTETAL